MFSCKRGWRRALLPGLHTCLQQLYCSRPVSHWDISFVPSELFGLDMRRCLRERRAKVLKTDLTGSNPYGRRRGGIRGVLWCVPTSPAAQHTFQDMQTLLKGSGRCSGPLRDVVAVKLDIQHLRNLVLTATAFRRELSQIQDAASALADALQLVFLLQLLRPQRSGFTCQSSST